MRVRFVTSSEYTPDHAWDAVPLASIDSATVQLHWTDSEYIWHVNDGTEVFIVIDGVVDMHHRSPSGVEQVTRLTPGTICVAEVGDEHKAVPVGPARIVVVEKAGSI